MYQPQSPIYNHHNYVNGKLASVLNHSHVADPSEVCDIVIIYSDMSGPLNWAQSIIPDLNMKATRFYPVMCINAWQRILTFDEHANMRKNHKFAVFFQQSGQTNEDEILANKTGSKKFAEFMRHLGKRVKLSDHKGYVNIRLV